MKFHDNGSECISPTDCPEDWHEVTCSCADCVNAQPVPVQP